MKTYLGFFLLYGIFELLLIFELCFYSV